MRYFDLTRYYDINANSFVEPKKESESAIKEFLIEIEDEIVELINRTLNKNKSELLSYIKNVEIKIEPIKTISSKYEISYEKAIKPILNNPSKYPHEFADELKKIIDKSKQSIEDFDIKAAIKDLLHKYDRNGALGDTASKIRVWLLGNEVAGTFTESGKGTITLYLLTISRHDEYNDYLLEVFAHEVFHAYHWFAANKRFSCDWNYKPFQKSTVKEGLASFFKHKYISIYNKGMAYELDKRLSNIEMNYYPYSSYKYIENDMIFENVFNKSLDDLGDAYNDLIVLKQTRFTGCKGCPRDNASLDE